MSENYIYCHAYMSIYVTSLRGNSRSWSVGEKLNTLKGYLNAFPHSDYWPLVDDERELQTHNNKQLLHQQQFFPISYKPMQDEKV